MLLPCLYIPTILTFFLLSWQCLPSIQWCAPTSPSSIFSSSTLSPSSASSSSPYWLFATRVAATTRAKRAKMVPLCSGLRSLISVTPPPVWTPQHSACTLARLTKQSRVQSPPLFLPHAHCGLSRHNAREPFVDSAYR